MSKSAINSTTFDRRKFLQLMTAMPMLSLAPSLLAGTAGQSVKTKGNKILVMVELKGGNDALNTLVPYEDSNYYRLRPKIAIKESQVLKLGNGFGMNPAMKALLPEWKSGDMAWVQGIGYPDPNRSHFRSIEIWESASNANQYLDEGWIAQLYRKTSSTNIQGVSIGSDVGPLSGENFNALLMQDKKSFIALTKRLRSVQAQTKNNALSHVLGVQNNVHSNAQLVTEKLKNTSSNSGVRFPKNKFGRQLETTSEIILSGLDVPVFKVEIGSFDTHQGQQKKQAKLLTQLSEGLSAFSSSMKKAGLWDDVLIVTYSEFGRRVKENASGGTDHGTAATHFALGGCVRGRVNDGLHNGFIGKTPSLSQLDNNDLRFTTDFRSYYHTIASDWLEVDSNWSSYGSLPMIES